MLAFRFCYLLIRYFVKIFIENFIEIEYSSITQLKFKGEIAMDFNISVIRGDGIGPEIVGEAIRVLDAVAVKYGHRFNYTEVLMGGVSIDATGSPLTDEAIETCKNSDAVLLGAIGGNTSTSPWYKLPARFKT